MKISVIMVAYDRNEQLQNTLDSYMANTQKETELEIIIVEEHKNLADPVMHEGLVKIIDTFIRVTNMLREYGSHINFRAHLMRDPFVGTYNACKKLNLGVEESTGDIIVITNPENKHCGNIFKDIEILFRGMPRQWVVWACKHDGGWHQHSEHAPHGWHYCAACTRDTWREIGGFDERFGWYISWEDNDLVRTIQKKGIPIRQIDYPYTFHQKHSHTWGLTEQQIQDQIHASQSIYKAKWGDDNITTVENQCHDAPSQSS